VGSAVLARTYDFSLSSHVAQHHGRAGGAGVLTHPHYLGRPGADRGGYRYYIDTLISFDRDPNAVPNSSTDQGLQSGEIPPAHEEASQFLAKLSHHTGVVIAPAEPEGRYRHIEFVRLRGTRCSSSS